MESHSFHCIWALAGTSHIFEKHIERRDIQVTENLFPALHSTQVQRQNVFIFCNLLLMQPVLIGVSSRTKEKLQFTKINTGGSEELGFFNGLTFREVSGAKTVENNGWPYRIPAFCSHAPSTRLQGKSQHPSRAISDKKSTQKSREHTSFIHLALHHNALLLLVMRQTCRKPQLIHPRSPDRERSQWRPFTGCRFSQKGWMRASCLPVPCLGGSYLLPQTLTSKQSATSTNNTLITSFTFSA